MGFTAQRVCKATLSIVLILMLLVHSTPPVLSDTQSLGPVRASKTITPTSAKTGDRLSVTLSVRGTATGVAAFDVVLVLDRSASMAEEGGKKIRDAKAAANTFVDLLLPIDRVGLVTYSSDIRSLPLVFADQADKTQIKNAVNGQSAGGLTNIYGAMDKAKSILTAAKRPNVPLVEILLTDGLPTCCSSRDTDKNAIKDLARTSSSSGITIYTIGLGFDADQDLLKMISQLTGGLFFFSPTSAELMDTFRDIFMLVAIAATDVVVREFIPTGGIVTFQNDATVTPTRITDSDITWNVGTLAGNQSFTVTFTYRANVPVVVDNSIVGARVEFTTPAGRQQINLHPSIRGLTVDVACTSLSLSKPKLMPGQAETLTARVSNTGEVATTFTVVAQLDGAEIARTDVTLNPGESRDLPLDVNTNGLQTGVHNVLIIVDPNNVLNESNENNNRCTGSFEIESNPILLVIVFLLLAVIMSAIAGAALIGKFPRKAFVCYYCHRPAKFSKRTRGYYCPHCRITFPAFNGQGHPFR